MRKIVWLDEYLKRWVNIAADKDISISHECNHKLSTLMGEDGIAVVSGRVLYIENDEEDLQEESECEIEDDEDDEMLYRLGVVIPYANGSIKGYLYEDYFVESTSSEYLWKKLTDIKVGDFVLLSGEYADSPFGEYANSDTFHLLPEEIKNYYPLDMELLDLQKIEKTADIKKYTVNNEGQFISAGKKKGWIKWLLIFLIGNTIFWNLFDDDKENTVQETETVVESVVSENATKTAEEDQTDNLGEDIVSESQSEAAVQTENPFEQYKDYPMLSGEYTLYYLCEKPIPFPDFSRYLYQMASDMGNMKAEEMYVYPAGWGKDEAYKKSPDVSDYIYSGETKDGQPDGVGTVYYVIHGCLEVSGPIYQKVYEGYFEKGKCTGFGISYTPAFRDCAWSFVCSEIGQRYNSEYEKYIHLYYNPIKYIGEYNDGSREGIGVRFDLPVDEADTYIKGIYTIQDATIHMGKFKNGEIAKEGQIYVNNFLLYEGEMKDGQKHGKGKLYYRNRKETAFVGTFKKDEVVKGTLYDLDGTVICDGEWSNGLCGLTDFYEIYYGNSILRDQDYRVELGDDYETYEALQGIFSETEPYIEDTISENIGGYILPDSDKRYLEIEELYGLDAATLRLARNEIFARHGRLFQTEDLNTYFSSQSWYNGYLTEEEFDDSVLNEFEKKNLELIQAAEQELQ